MSFDINYFNRVSSGANEKATIVYSYRSTTETLATITTSAYFNYKINQLKVNDFIFIAASDGTALAVVTSVTTNVALEVIVQNAASNYVAFAGEHTTVGGAAAEAITVTGVLATDLVLVTLKNQGAVPQKILTAASSADTVTVTFDGDPLNDHVVTYTVLRAY